MNAEQITDACQVAIVHCGQLMRWRGSGTSWVGKPGEGSQRDEVRFACHACPATATVAVEEPA